ncbi:MAG: DUF1178 family protein [Proteobacteria bacterium]|nr:DUF1178 family protein [Pseudomonadota bacterium]
MIIYDFHCEFEHRFEGWFGSQDDCERQVLAGQVHCPVCDSSTVARLPSALHVKSAARDNQPAAGATSRGSEHPAPVAAQGASETSSAGAVQAPAELREAVDRLRRWVAATEDVGRGFADEARRIHNQEAPERAIRGVATPAETRALVEEGVPVLPLPAHLVDKQH